MCKNGDAGFITDCDGYAIDNCEDDDHGYHQNHIFVTCIYDDNNFDEGVMTHW